MLEMLLVVDEPWTVVAVVSLSELSTGVEVDDLPAAETWRHITLNKHTKKSIKYFPFTKIKRHEIAKDVHTKRQTALTVKSIFVDRELP